MSINSSFITFIIAGATLVFTPLVIASELSNDAVELSASEPAVQPVRGTGVAPSPAEPKLLSQAESNYQAGRYVHAIEQFGMVAAMNNHPLAWLRIGNVWHRRGNAAMALDAYRRASELSATSEQHRKLWSRAMMNMTLLGIDQARQAVVALGPAQKETASAQWASEIRTRIQELQRALPGGLPAAFDNTERAPLVAPVKKARQTKRKRSAKGRNRRSKAIAQVRSD